jgi:hypothetical protein
MLLDLGAPAERLPVVKTILTQSGITKENLHELIRFSESPMGMHRPFPGFGGSDGEIDQIAADLQAEKTMYRSHYLDHD